MPAPKRPIEADGARVIELTEAAEYAITRALQGYEMSTSDQEGLTEDFKACSPRSLRRSREYVHS